MPARHAPPALTRRRFLGRRGAVGGSSLVMTAMSSWELMAGAAGQRPALEGRPRHATETPTLVRMETLRRATLYAAGDQAAGSRSSRSARGRTRSRPAASAALKARAAARKDPLLAANMGRLGML